MAVKIVDDIDEAISHINVHSSHHSEAIVTTNYAHAQRFLQRVNSAAVYVNASTRVYGRRRVWFRGQKSELVHKSFMRVDRWD